MCWQHTKSLVGLRIKPSQIDDAGFGLYATRRFAKNEKIDDYSGEKLTREEIGERYDGARGEYVLCRSERECFDAAKTSASYARFANSTRGTSLRPNARFTRGSARGFPILRASRPITNGSEIFASYGRDYWR